MSRLEGLAAPPRTPPRTAPPHFYRRLGGRVLVGTEWGRYEWLREAEYAAALLRSGERALFRDNFDAGAAARGIARASLLGWRGPVAHILRLSAQGAVMGATEARLAVDFAFSCPTADVRIELVAEEPDPVWPSLVFAAEYAVKKAGWARKSVELWWRGRRSPERARLERLRSLGVRVRWEGEAAGTPPEISLHAERALLWVEAPASQARAWVTRLAEAGVASMRLEPGAVWRRSLAGTRRFLAFYRAALERLRAGAALRDEWAEGFERRQPWSLPGMDLLAELAYGPGGEVFTSELALAAGEESFRLGRLGELRYEQLADSPVVRACLAAAMPENQPLCFSCAYRPLCALPPSGNRALQGTIWGQTPSSPLCALRMGILDALFLGRRGDGPIFSTSPSFPESR